MDETCPLGTGGGGGGDPSAERSAGERLRADDTSSLGCGKARRGLVGVSGGISHGISHGIGECWKTSISYRRSPQDGCRCAAGGEARGGRSACIVPGAALASSEKNAGNSKMWWFRIVERCLGISPRYRTSKSACAIRVRISQTTQRPEACARVRCFSSQSAWKPRQQLVQVLELVGCCEQGSNSVSPQAEIAGFVQFAWFDLVIETPEKRRDGRVRP
jgi:hypothetical protein